jgi:hypothetical protein
VDGTNECKTVIVGVGGSGVGEGVPVAVAISVGVTGILAARGVLEGVITAGAVMPWGFGRLHARIKKIIMKLNGVTKLFFLMGSLLAAIIILFVIEINRNSKAYASLARQTKFRHNSTHSEYCEEK